MSNITTELARLTAAPYYDMGYMSFALDAIAHGVSHPVAEAAPKKSAWPRAQEHVEMHLASDWFREWFAGSYVTVDGKLDGKPLMAFRGCGEGHNDIAPEGIAFWLTSSRMNAAFFEDGEMQNCYARLANPLVISHAQLHASGRSVSDMVAAARARVELGLADWDGVVLMDVLDGTHPSTIYAVFPKDGTVSHAVQMVG